MQPSRYLAAIPVLPEGFQYLVIEACNHIPQYNTCSYICKSNLSFLGALLRRQNPIYALVVLRLDLLLTVPQVPARGIRVLMTK